MDVHQLKTLIHVAELGSLSKAADRLRIAQPALSRQIRMLEQEIGQPLFERHGRGMQITDVGRDVLAHATRIMAELDAIRATTSGGGSSYRGAVTIGMTSTVAEIATVPVAARVKREHPQLAIRFASAFSGHVLDWLQRGEVDIGISYDPQPMRSLRIRPVMTESLLLVGAGEEGLDRSEAVAFASLAGRDLVLPSPRHGLRAIVEDCARKAGIALTASVEADSFGGMIALVRGGFGPTILPLAPIYAQVERGELSAAPLVDPAPTRRVVLAFPADRPVSPAARFVGDAFMEIAADLVGRGVWLGHKLAPDRG
ncbi:LysR substrate-binding domain-containing protein [Methylopila sp. Yamaguchi]|uniref:LysR substrate-binding domain-containing protein n=1 Tax=Methylopila sp. Yamaguchi TaxID=1437817 RepID=UPI000CB54ED4|nr:LysR substrate-binding domain-containing protein [Methylopila sp. Yamaguchi]GBD48606.1 LysR family transcriptional regulator [Methylopila sp. Yamaguchi]